jgi:hypothetical protein
MTMAWELAGTDRLSKATTIPDLRVFIFIAETLLEAPLESSCI